MTIEFTDPVSTASATMGTTEWIKAHLERMDATPPQRPSVDNDPTPLGTST